MKFQNPHFKLFLNGRTHAGTEGQAESNLLPTFSKFYILFVVNAAGVVPCGSPKKRPRTSSIVRFIFYFWSIEISRNILRNQKIL